MIYVCGGSFLMGSATPEDVFFGHEDQHLVTVSDFFIGKYEVTQKLWKDIMGTNPSTFSKDCDDCPVENVSWNDVQEFLKKINARFPGKKYRLPTEAEWEFAARGGMKSKGFHFSGSNDLNEVGWFWKNSGDKPLSEDWELEKLTSNNCRTHPVGKKKANELWLFDMSGNVWEWCSDWFDEKYYESCHKKEAILNPCGPEEGVYRVVRGGSYFNRARGCRVSYRFNVTPDGRYDVIGFRLAESV